MSDARPTRHLRPSEDAARLTSAIYCFRKPVAVEYCFGQGRKSRVVDMPTGVSEYGRHIAILPPAHPEFLGEAAFRSTHQTRYAYVVGEMANGISSTEMVAAAAKTGFLGLFGAAGLSLACIDAAVSELSGSLHDKRNWGVNLIHSPQEPSLENAAAALLIARDVPVVSASAFLKLTPSIVRCAVQGLAIDASGQVRRPRRIMAKVSRPEVAEQFMSPPPAPIVAELLADGLITETEATLARRISMADDLTVEGDSGGHTDNRPLTALLPRLISSRYKVCRRTGVEPIRLGAAGGIGTPEAAAAAFAMGAAYIVTGSVNQAAVESSVCTDVKDLLTSADLTDVTMAPASDMFEMGVKLQVLRRGSMFAGRASQLYRAYTTYESIGDIPLDIRTRLEKTVLGESFDDAWTATQMYWNQRDPAQVIRARTDPRHLLALVCRSYLGRASHWAIDGDSKRRNDYQVWCGPVMGSFNAWVQDSFLEQRANRTVAQLGLNILEGATALTRAAQLRCAGVEIPADAVHYTPTLLTSDPEGDF